MRRVKYLVLKRVESHSRKRALGNVHIERFALRPLLCL